VLSSFYQTIQFLFPYPCAFDPQERLRSEKLHRKLLIKKKKKKKKKKKNTKKEKKI